MSAAGRGENSKASKGIEEDRTISISASGQDEELWDKRKTRFFQRTMNSVKKMFGNDIPPKATLFPELECMGDQLLETTHERLKGPALVNMERQASVMLKLAEVKEKEANARKTELESDLLEVERNRVLESQRHIDLLIQRGELVVSEKDGEVVLIYRPTPTA